MRRGEFLKMTCTGCMLGGVGVLSVIELLSCAPAGGSMKALHASREGNKLTLPAAGIKSGSVNIVQGKGMDYDVALRQLEDGQYEALLLRCTHFNNPLVRAGEEYSCSLHGSKFDEHGAVKAGPASAPLTKLPCKVEGSNLVIYI